MDAKIEGQFLVVRVPLLPPNTSSKSGKTISVATTNGNHATTCQVNGKPLIVGLNAYIKP